MRDELEFRFFSDDVAPDSQGSICEDKENEKSPNDFIKVYEPRFKAAARKVIRRLKLMAKGFFIDDNLPDPDEMPIEVSNVNNYHSNHIPEQSPFSGNFEGTFKEEIFLNNSYSNKGFCILYRDVKTQNCRVEEICNEFSCRGFFEWFSCYHLMPDSAQIIIFDLNLKVIKAFHYLLQSNARAAPIWDSERREFIAMLTITDFIKILHQYRSSNTLADLEELEDNTIKDWIKTLHTSESPNLIHISPECNLKNAVSIIGDNNIHRLPVVDPLNGNILSIITNSQLFRFFYRKFAIEFNLLTPAYMLRTPTNLGLGRYSNDISIIYPWQTIYDAFDIFVRNQISVLPVVDEDRRLIDIYARYDVVALAESDKYRSFDLSISEALELRKLKRPPCTCNKENSLQQIIQIIYEAQVHRVFIVDEVNHILGVISLSDILAFLCEM